MNRTYQQTLDTYGIHPRVSHAISICVFILESEPYLALHRVATKLNISNAYVEQIVRLLREHNIVAAQRGPGGGYYLVDDPKDLSLAKILDAITQIPKNPRELLLRKYVRDCLENVSLWEFWKKSKRLQTA